MRRDSAAPCFIYRDELREKDFFQAMDWGGEIIRLGTQLTNLQERFCLVLDRRAFDFARHLPDPTAMSASFAQRLCESNPYLVGMGYDERLVPGYAQLKTAAGDRVVLHIIHERFLSRGFNDRSGFTSREMMTDMDVRREFVADSLFPWGETPRPTPQIEWRNGLTVSDIVEGLEQAIARSFEAEQVNLPDTLVLTRADEARLRTIVTRIRDRQEAPESATPSDPDYLLGAIAHACENNISGGSAEMSTLRLLCKKLLEIDGGVRRAIANSILCHVSSTGMMTPAELRRIVAETEGAAEAIAHAKQSRDCTTD